MVLKFLLFFIYLRLSHLFQIQQEKIIHNTYLGINKVMKISGYRKNNSRY